MRTFIFGFGRRRATDPRRSEPRSAIDDHEPPPVVNDNAEPGHDGAGGSGGLVIVEYPAAMNDNVGDDDEVFD